MIPSLRTLFSHFAYVTIVLSVSTLSAQSETDQYIGKTIDGKTGEPVVFATILFEGTGLGVITNSDGIFRVPADTEKQSTHFVVSSMGYASRRINISALQIGEIFHIRLDQAVIDLEEVTISARKRMLSAKQIVRNAIAQIESNNPQETFGYVGYYRDYQMKEKAYLNLNEAIIEVQDQGFHTVDTTSSKFKILRSQRNLNFESDSFAAKPYDYQNFDKTIPHAFLNSYRANEFMILRVHDPIRNYQIRSFSFIEQFSKDLISNHTLRLQKSTSFNGHAVYRVSLRKETPETMAEGMLFIDQVDFSIRRLDYSVSSIIQKEPVSTSHYEMHSAKSPNSGFPIFEVVVEYRKGPNDKMYLNYVSFQNGFELINPPVFKIERATLDQKQRQVEIYLNKPAANWEDLKYADFKLRYNGKDIKLAQVIDRDKATYLLKIDYDRTQQRALVNQLFSKTVDPEKTTLEIEIMGMRDEAGNLLGARKHEFAKQYREFFVQEILEKPKHNDSLDSNWMHKNRPVFESAQPVTNDIESGRYWMNTPLKN